MLDQVARNGGREVGLDFFFGEEVVGLDRSAPVHTWKNYK